jgi:hypothetical protein
MKRLTAILMSCMLITCGFASCGSDDDSDSKSGKKATTTASAEAESELDDFFGKWEAFKVEDEDGEVYEDEYQGAPISELLRAEILDDGTITLFSYGGDEDESEWTDEEDGTISVEDEDGVVTIFSIDEDGNLVAEEDDATFYFKKVKKFTESETETEEDTTKATKEKETKEKSTKETETKEKETKEDTTKATKESGNGGFKEGEVDKELLGKWTTKEGGFDGWYEYKEDGKGSVYLDSSSIIHFEGDKIYFQTTELGPDKYTFEDGKFSLNVNGRDILTMEKIEGGNDTFDGKYNVTSGLLYDQYDKTYKNTDDYSFTFEADGKNSILGLNNCFTYSADGEKIYIGEGSSLFNNKEFDYTIDGKKLTLKAGIAQQILTRD